MQPQDPAATPHHAQHDATLIAGFAAGDLTAVERTRAQSLVDACTECSSLRDDLVAIASATHALPAARAPRDFRISAEQAARLRRTGWLGTLLAPFAGSRSAAKPLATAFTTLGLVGVFVAAAIPGMTGGAAYIGAPEAAPGVGANPGAVASAAPAAPGAQFGPQATTGSDAGYGTKDDVQASGVPLSGETAGGQSTGGQSTGGPATGGESSGDGRDLGGNGGGRIDAPASPMNALLLGSLAFLAVGLVLFGLRFAGRRLR